MALKLIEPVRRSAGVANPGRRRTMSPWPYGIACAHCGDHVQEWQTLFADRDRVTGTAVLHIDCVKGLYEDAISILHTIEIGAIRNEQIEHLGRSQAYHDHEKQRTEAQNTKDTFEYTEILKLLVKEGIGG